MNFNGNSDVEEFNCPVLGDVALIQLTRRSHTLPSGGLQYGAPAFDGCSRVYDCGIIATPLRGGGYSFDWFKCPAWRSINSSGNV